MRSRIDRQRHLAGLAAIAIDHAQPSARATRTAPAAGDGPALPQSCLTWLSELALLYGVPFDTLVPVAAMLPPETIRFFYVDDNFVHRLIDGAASVGVGSSLDALVLYGEIEALVDQVAGNMIAVRPRRIDRPAVAQPAAGGTPPTVSGFLLRSALVAGWPGLEVTATDSAGTPLRLLRLDRLSTDVVICLLSGVPAQVQIHQPPESLHFGVIDDNVSMSATLRYAAGANAGQQIYRNGAAVTVPVTTRTGSVDGVVDVTKTAAAMVAALAMDPGAFGGAEFAIEMVQSAGVQPFIRNPQQSGGK